MGTYGEGEERENEFNNIQVLWSGMKRNSSHIKNIKAEQRSTDMY